jgi:hypothetical protein
MSKLRLRTRLFYFFSLSLAVAPLAACGQPMGVVDAKPIAAAALCGEIATVLCNADATCCRSHSETCVVDQRTACETVLSPLVDDPRLGYDERRGGFLVDTLRIQAEQCWQDAPDYEALVGAFGGTGQAGADCTPRDLSKGALRVSALSCAQGTACRLYLRADDSVEGECAARTDDACSHPLDCGANEFCSLASD